MNDKQIKYIVTRVNSTELANDYQIPEIMKQIENKNQRVRHRRSITSIARPEILVIVDSTLYEKLDKDVFAVNEYVRNFWSAVNLRFKTLTNPKVELNIAGIVISKSTSATPYM